jgi:hypothetical protein
MKSGKKKKRQTTKPKRFVSSHKKKYDKIIQIKNFSESRPETHPEKTFCTDDFVAFYNQL